MADKDPILRTTSGYRKEGEAVKLDRLNQNKKNWDCYHLNGDYSEKVPGQSKEFLPKQFVATEQFASFVQQALIDLGDSWFSVSAKPGVMEETLPINSDHVKILTAHYLRKAGFYTHIADAMKLGALEGLPITKIHGERVVKPTFKVERREKNGRVVDELKKIKNMVWEPRLSSVRPDDFIIDPKMKGLYILQNIELDIHEFRRLSKDPAFSYDAAAVEQAISSQINSDPNRKSNIAQVTGQNQETDIVRKTIEITECWGDIIDPETGDLLYEDVFWVTSKDDTLLLHPPIRNPLWVGKPPYITAPIIRVPFAVWPKAIMDAASALNVSVNEMFNLILDGGIRSVFGVNQIRRDYLEDESQVSNGVIPGTTLEVSSAAPPNAKVFDSTPLGEVPNDALATYELLNSEFQQGVFTNDLRLGQLPGRAVKATEVVEASQSIAGVFTGITKNIEAHYIRPLLEMFIAIVFQNADDLDSDNVVTLLGSAQARKLAALSPAQRFAFIMNGFKFEVTGLSETISKTRDYRKIVTFLQTISSSEALIQAFSAKYDFGALLEIVLRTLDVNPAKLKLQGQQTPSNIGATSVPGGQNQTNNVQSAATLGDFIQSTGIPRTQFAPQPAATQPLPGEQS